MARDDWRSTFPDLDNVTVVGLEWSLSWVADMETAQRLRLQVYHEYPSASGGGVTVGIEHFRGTGTSPLKGDLENVTIPIASGGQILFVVAPDPDVAYYATPGEEFHLEVAAMVRPIAESDFAGLKPPQRR